MHWTEPATADDSHAALEKTLWGAANQLWSNAALKPSEYSPTVKPVASVCDRRTNPCFTRHPLRSPRKHFRKSSDGRRPTLHSTSSHLFTLPEGANVGQAINEAMRAIPSVVPIRNLPRHSETKPGGTPRTDNGNYLWIQHFHSALNKKGRAGFVMAALGPKAFSCQFWPLIVSSGSSEGQKTIRSHFR